VLTALLIVAALEALLIAKRSEGWAERGPWVGIAASIAAGILTPGARLLRGGIDAVVAVTLFAVAASWLTAAIKGKRSGR
jgi:hypothetical protein